MLSCMTITYVLFSDQMKSNNNNNNRHKNQLELNVVLLNSEHLTFTIFNCTVNSYLKTTLTS